MSISLILPNSSTISIQKRPQHPLGPLFHNISAAGLFVSFYIISSHTISRNLLNSSSKGLIFIHLVSRGHFVDTSATNGVILINSKPYGHEVTILVHFHLL